MRTTTRLAAMRAAAAAGALAVGLAGFGLGATAVAADANIDDTQQTSLTIHKHVKQPAPGTTKARPDGSKDLQQAAVEGVKFKAYQIDLDMTQQAGWAALDEFTENNPALDASVCDTPELPGGKLGLKAGAETAFSPTSANGETKATLEKGAYLICETDTAGAKVDGTEVKIVDKALPFIVTLPFPDNAGAGAAHNWIYDVHSYPKNTPVNKPVKKVKVDGESHGLNAGDQITYTIDAKIPDVDDNTENFKYFNIYDQLTKETADIRIDKVEIGDSVDGDGNLVGAAAVDAGMYTKTVEEAGRFAQVDFNSAAGLSYLKENPDKTIRMTIKAKLTAVPADGNIRNTGNLLVDTETIPHDPNTPPDQPTPPVPPVTPPVTPPTTPDTPPTTPPGNPPVPTNTVVSNWGDLKVLKQDENNNKTLQGASFQVYNAKDPFAADCSKAEKTGDPVSVNGESTFTSGADGTFTLAGLFVDSKDGAETKADLVPDHTTRCYVLVETAAPAGYTLPTGADAETGVTVNAGITTADQDLVINNTKTSVPALPMTGASGQVLMMAGGAALVLLSAGTVMVARRRSSED